MTSPENADALDRLRQENRRLQRSVLELSVLNDVATAIGSTMALDKIIELIIEKCVKHFRVEQGAVLLLDERQDQISFRTMVRKLDTTGYRKPYRLDTELSGWMLKHRRPLVVNDFASDGRFSGGRDGPFEIRSLLAAPLMLKSKMIGLICLFNKKPSEGFTPDDQRLLSILAVESAQVIENARLYQEEQELRRVQEELRVASDIQRGLLPKAFPEIEGYDIAAVNLPARVVSGDYYDFINLPDGNLGLCLGDVSGKGMPAALLMANLQAIMRAQALLGLPPQTCVQNVNFLLFRNTTPEKFATLFYGVLNPKSHTLTYCNAGHDPPFVFSADGSVRRLETGGTVVGFLEKMPFSKASAPLKPGDVFLLYSDGVTEAMDEREEEFGEERLQEVAQRSLCEPASVLISAVLSAVREFTGDRPASDDVTVVAIKRTH